jgi:hypothetical protein
MRTHEVRQAATNPPLAVSAHHQLIIISSGSDSTGTGLVPAEESKLIVPEHCGRHKRTLLGNNLFLIPKTR